MLCVPARLCFQPALQQICIPDSSSSSKPPSPASAPAYGYYSCSAGKRQVFPRSVIHGAHYMLFYLAIIHILFSLFTSVITNFKVWVRVQGARACDRAHGGLRGSAARQRRRS